jgi:uncharacterized repeat protein (TIGR03803 family)
MADASGNLFGTTELGGTSGDGTVFEIANSGFITSADLPEPATIIVLGVGIVGRGVIRRRRTSPARPGRLTGQSSKQIDQSSTHSAAEAWAICRT